MSYAERQKILGKRKDTLADGESRHPFGFCCLTLQPPKFPMASIQGWIFDKDAVVEFITSERDDLKRQLDEWEQSEKETLKLSSKGSGRVDASGKHAKDESRPRSFWTSVSSEHSSGVVSRPRVVSKPDSTPKCPVSGCKLRFKDLIPVRLESTSDEDAERGVYSCAISKRHIGHQQALLIKPSGIVVLESAFKTSCAPDSLRCPVSGAQLAPTDIIRLQKGSPS